MDCCSIYIHIPFCIRKCLYCDFLSGCYDYSMQDDYIEALIKEITAFGKKDILVKTIYIGGGTPSCVDAEWIKRILDTVRASFDVACDAEISMEMNPGTESMDKLRIYFEAGVNRISIGCQSLDDNELRELGRIHSADDFRQCYEDVRKSGFENVNVDIMSALPGQTVESYMSTVREICSLKPEHISAYSLIIEEGTEFFRRYGDVSVKDCYDVETPSLPGFKKLPTEDDERKMYDMADEFLSANGYHRYEISNYAKNSTDAGGTETGHFECRHNRVYWQRGQYIGFGIGAASMVDNVRYNNIRDISKYISIITNDIGADSAAAKDLFPGLRENIEELDIHAQMEEFMFLGLRLTEGISMTKFKETFLFPIKKIYGKVISSLESEGLIVEAGDSLKLTERGTAVSNYAMAKFLFD